MFQIGDRVIYPMQGAGIIQGIEDKEVSGTPEKYFIINILSNKMQVMVPLSKAPNTGIRLVSDENMLKDVLINFKTKKLFTSQELSYRERYHINMAKVKTGKIMEGSEVVHDLMLLGENKPLNSSEKQLLLTAKKILISEISIIKGISESNAEDLLSSNFS
ncbi:CarD family transcriptional regulator [Clostridium paridis]|uniref:Transcription factor YdeB n=1 Tax=Clostridium paridis TaxID=2803863 RepID=A0A937K6F7_9CLOT|nr:CarD family transcriptional regulator [Clostridium paridis]MBL4933778.1 transcription factor YdeB [Clostridium paridis]